MSGSDATPMARVTWLDAGALGIICPMVSTRAQVETLVGYCRYAPDGMRSFGPTRAVTLYGAGYPSRANDQVVTIAMVETREALENLESIVTTPGLGGVYIGPSDLGLSLACPPMLHPEEPAVLEPIGRAVRVAHETGIKAGIHCVAPSYAKRMIALGFDLATVGSDLRLLGAGLQSTIAAMRDV